MNPIKIEFPKSSWEKLYEKLDGFNLKNNYYHDEIFRNDNYQYEFDFYFKDIRAKFKAIDFTHNIKNSGPISIEKNKDLIISFEYKIDPNVEIHIYKKNAFFHLINKILFKDVSLKNTPIFNKYIFESNKPRLAKDVINDLIFISESGLDLFKTNKNINYKSAKYHLEFNSNEWFDNYDKLIMIIEKMHNIYKRSLMIEFKEERKIIG